MQPEKTLLKLRHDTSAQHGPKGISSFKKKTILYYNKQKRLIALCMPDHISIGNYMAGQDRERFSDYCTLSREDRITPR